MTTASRQSHKYTLHGTERQRRGRGQNTLPSLQKALWEGITKYKLQLDIFEFPSRYC